MFVQTQFLPQIFYLHNLVLFQIWLHTKYHHMLEGGPDSRVCASWENLEWGIDLIFLGSFLSSLTDGSQGPEP